MSTLVGFGVDSLGVTYTLDADPINQQRQRVFEPTMINKFHRKNAMSSKGIVCTDFDGDGNDEVCVCSLGGELVIYKINNNENWKCCICPTAIGSITSVVSGNIKNTTEKSNTLIVLTAEGKGLLFEWNKNFMKKVSTDTTEKSQPTNEISNLMPDYHIFPVQNFEVPCNISAALVSKIGNRSNNNKKKTAYIFL